MKKLEYLVRTIADKFNIISAAALVIIMLVIILDITMRIFRIPLPGAYDVVSLLSVLVIAFSLTYTTIQNGHIAVDLVYQKIPDRYHPYIDFFNYSAGSLFFAVLSWQCFLYSISLRAAGEVTLTVKIPTYPFVAGIGLSSLLPSIYLLLNVFKAARRIKKR